MESSLNEIETNQSLRSPPRRRRSTFFERRDSIVSQNQLENVAPDICKQSEESHEMHKDYLNRYYEQLLAEKEQWKKEVIARRNKYHDVRQQYQISKKQPSSTQMSYSALTNEDIEFIKGKPNISKLVDSQQKLHKSVKETKALFRRLNELDDVVLSFCEDKVNEVTEYIFENSAIEQMDIAD